MIMDDEPNYVRKLIYWLLELNISVYGLLMCINRRHLADPLSPLTASFTPSVCFQLFRLKACSLHDYFFKNVNSKQQTFDNFPPFSLL